MNRLGNAWVWGAVLALGAVLASPAGAGPSQNPEWPHAGSPGTRGGAGDVQPSDAPDIVGPGKVSTVANVWMKSTNIGILGNPFTAQSSDPSAQWPGASGVEYLFFVGLWIGAKDATVSDPALLRRVSHNTEWRPPSLDPADRIYQTFDGAVGGGRFANDDGDDEIDEDPLDGHDNDDDGFVDEDFAAISQQMFTCLIRDDTPQALEAAFAERHVQRGLEVRQSTYAFSVPGTNDFVSVEWEVENISGHVLDSVYVGMFVEQDVGPTARDRYFSDDLPEPRVPQGPDLNVDMAFDDPNNPNRVYLENVSPRDPRYQGGLCARDTVHVNGFTMTDDDGDMGATPGASSFLLLGHTIDPTGVKAPRHVGFRMYTFFQPGVPFIQGGSPTNDIERYQILSSTRNVDPVTGMINAEPPDRNEINDYFSLCSVGPFLDMQPGEKVKVAWAVAVQEVDYTARPDELQERFVKVVDNAIRAQKTYRGTYQQRQGFDFPPDDPTGFGRETCLRLIPGGPTFSSDCHDDSVGAQRPLDNDDCTWFDLDCNYCTGVGGQIAVPWTASSPPPNPQLRMTPLDRAVRLEWDNRSEYTPDPVEGTFDIAGYKIWKAANWTRPVGSSGPGDDLWSLLATYYLYDPTINPLIEIRDGVPTPDPRLVLVNREDPDSTHRIYPVLEGELTASGEVMHCLENDFGVCDTSYAKKLTFDSVGRDSTIEAYPVVKYPLGRYSITDRNVLNGFLYFYSVTAFDSTGRGGSVAKLEGRQAAVEGDAIVPQDASAAGGDGEPFVVPNPYRGRAEWDLTPSAADPTGTHVDFFNLPGGWTRLKIYTISGDLVEELTPDDIQTNGRPQREGPDDSQASWNLISRNGQDVVSGIYIFSVEAGGEARRGKFIVIR